MKLNLREPSFFIGHRGSVPLCPQLVALAVSHLLALALAKLAQRLNINTVFPNFCSIVSGCLAAKLQKVSERNAGDGEKTSIRELRSPTRSLSSVSTRWAWTPFLKDYYYSMSNSDY